MHYLIVTHLDPDHGGETDAFPNAEIVIQRDHYEAALHATDHRYTMNRAHWDAPGLRYRMVDGDVEFLPGIELIGLRTPSPGQINKG